MRTKTFLICVLMVSAAFLAGCGEGKMPEVFKKPEVKTQAPAAQGTVLFSVNGRVTTLEDFNGKIETYNSGVMAATDVTDEMKQNYLIRTAEDKKRLLNSMIETDLLVVEAQKRGLDKDADVQNALEDFKKQLLFAKIIESVRSQTSVTSKEVENFYNINKEVFSIPEERKVSVIVVPGEEKAKELLIMLLQGADFGATARENSIDPSATSGGDIGLIVRKSPYLQPGKKTMFDKLEETAFGAELNRPTTVFEGPNGFYIVKVTEVKPARERALSEIYPDIEQGLTLQKQEGALKELVGNLRKSGNVTMYDELLKD